MKDGFWSDRTSGVERKQQADAAQRHSAGSIRPTYNGAKQVPQHTHWSFTAVVLLFRQYGPCAGQSNRADISPSIQPRVYGGPGECPLPEGSRTG